MQNMLIVRILETIYFMFLVLHPLFFILNEFNLDLFYVFKSILLSLLTCILVHVFTLFYRTTQKHQNVFIRYRYLINF